MVPAGVLGLTIGDEVPEATTNPCPIFAGGDPPDFDGVAPGPGCDNCPGTVNPGQEDTDGDLIGDACDPCTDTDADGFGNMDFPANLCPVDCVRFAGANLDGDGDGWADECDNCPLIPNTGQADTDFDGAGNVCDSARTSSGPSRHPSTRAPSKRQLGFKNNGPGTSDDSAKTGGAFNRSAVRPRHGGRSDRHTVEHDERCGAQRHVDAGRRTVDPTQSGEVAWKYATVVNPIVKAQVKESPTGSTELQVEGRREECELPGPQILPATDDIRVTLEMPSQSLCFEAVLGTCTSTALKKDACKLP